MKPVVFHDLLDPGICFYWNVLFILVSKSFLHWFTWLFPLRSQYLDPFNVFFFSLWITIFSAFDHIIYVVSKILNAYSPVKVVLHLRKKCCSSSWKTLVTGRFDWLQQECKVNIFLINIAPLGSLFDVLKLILSAELVSK